MAITWETIAVVFSILSGVAAIFARVNALENEYQAGKNKLKELESRLEASCKDLEIQRKESERVKAQVGREFNNIAWQLRIIIGSMKDVESFLEASSNYTRRRGSEVINEEDTRGFMLKKIRELDSPEE